MLQLHIYRLTKLENFIYRLVLLNKEVLEMIEEMKDSGITKLSEVEYNHIEEVVEQMASCTKIIHSVLP